MADIENKLLIETKAVPTVYCNHAVTSMSYADLRLYLSEVSPKELIANPTSGEMVQKEPNLDPRMCVVMTPEFARLIANALTTAVERYESVFGQLRPEPKQDVFASKLISKI